MKNAYPVVFEKAEEGGYCVYVPDIEGCFTQGDDMTDALEMAKDAIEMMIVVKEDYEEKIPNPSTIAQIEERIKNKDKYFEDLTENYEISYVAINSDEWRRENTEKPVKLKLEIPRWLNRLAKRANIDLSQILQNALKKELNLV